MLPCKTSISTTTPLRPRLFPCFLSTPLVQPFRPPAYRPRVCAARRISQPSLSARVGPNTRRVAATALLIGAAILRGAGLPAASRGAGFIAVLASLSLLVAPRPRKPPVAPSGNELFAGSRSAWAADDVEEEEAAAAPPRALSSPAGLVRAVVVLAARVLNEFLVPLLNALRLAWFDMQVTARSSEVSNGADKFFLPPMQSGRRRKKVPWEGVSWDWVPPRMDDRAQDRRRDGTPGTGELSEEEKQIMRLGNAAKGAAKQAKSAATQATDALRGFFDRLT